MSEGYRAARRAQRRETPSDNALSIPTEGRKLKTNELPPSKGIVVGLKSKIQADKAGSSHDVAVTPILEAPGADPISFNKQKDGPEGNVSRDAFKKKKHYWEYVYNSGHYISDDPLAIAHLLQNFRKPGFNLPRLDQLSEDDNNNYVRFAGALGQLASEFNRVVKTFSTKLQGDTRAADLKSAQDSIAAMEEELSRLRLENVTSADAVKLSNDRLYELRQAEIARDDYKAKLERVTNDMRESLAAQETSKSEISELNTKLSALVSHGETKTRIAVFETRKDLAGKVKIILDQVKSHLDGRDAVRDQLVKASGIKSNFELLEDIIKGDIIDLPIELALVSAYKDEALRELAEVEGRIPALELSELELFIQNIQISTSVSPDAPFDQYGTNGASNQNEMEENASGTNRDL